MNDPEVIYKAERAKRCAKTHEKLSTLPVAVFDDWESLRAYNPQDKDPKPVLGVFFPEQFPTTRMGKRTLRLKDLSRESRHPPSRTREAVFSDG